MNLSKFVRTKTGKYMMSIIFGLGLATLFKYVCKGRNCITYMAPQDINDEDTVKYNGSCYKVTTDAVTCDKNKKIYEIH